MKERYKEFELDGEKYRTGRIDAITQLGIAMKLGPVLPAFGHVREYMKLNPDFTFGDLDPGLLKIVGDAMGSMPEASLNFVLEKILKVVDKQEGPGWLPMWDDHAKSTVYPIDLRQLIGLLMRAFEFNLESFTGALGLNSSARPGA